MVGLPILISIVGVIAIIALVKVVQLTILLCLVVSVMKVDTDNEKAIDKALAKLKQSGN